MGQTIKVQCQVPQDSLSNTQVFLCISRLSFFISLLIHFTSCSLPIPSQYSHNPSSTPLFSSTLAHQALPDYIHPLPLRPDEAAQLEEHDSCTDNSFWDTIPSRLSGPTGRPSCKYGKGRGSTTTQRLAILTE